PAPVPTSTAPIIKTSYAPSSTQTPATTPSPAGMPAVKTSLLPAPSSSAPMMAAPVLPTSPAHLLGVLGNSPPAAQREGAALSLGAFDGWLNPALVQGLVVAARADAAPNVRAASLYSLGRMNVRTLPVISTVQAAKADTDPRVRAEAERALAILSQGEA